MKHYSRVIWPVIGVSALIFCSWLLSRELADVSISDLWAAFTNISHKALLGCFLSTLVAYAALAWYDRIALLHLGHKLSWVFISLTSFTTYAISHNIGISMFSGGLIRYRAYSTKGLNFSEVATLVLFCSFTFAFGTVILTSGVLLFRPDFFAHLFAVPSELMWWSGVGLLILVICYGVGSLLHLRPLKIGSFELVYPRPEIAFRQYFAAPIELLGAAGILYFALPAEVNPGYIIVLGIFLLSFSLALLSHAPGGLGVLEFMFFKAMPDVPHAQLLTALILFRVFYLLLPLVFGVCVALFFEHGHLREAWRRVKTEAAKEEDMVESPTSPSSDASHAQITSEKNKKIFTPPTAHFYPQSDKANI